ncbi:MAG: hypothetical protein KJO07_22875 [Deltaproteobacteria bacterium]|nr:hypothetical protein [Deltaproteobacteria bacterium]
MKWVLAALVLCAGCQDIELSAMHAPPPGAELSVDRDEQRIELSVGTAAAIECIYGGYDPCTDVEIEGGDGTVTVYPLHIAGLDQYSWNRDQPRAGFVVVGSELGVTEIEVRSSEGEKRYQIEVVE